MLEKLLYFNNKKLGSYNLVFKNFKIRWHIFSFFMYLSLIYIPIEIFVIFSLKFRIANLLVFIPLVLLFILLFNLNAEAKSFINQKYEIRPEGYLWRTVSFDEYQVNLLVRYLKNDNLYSVTIVEKLISLVSREAEGKRYTGYIWPGVFLTLLIPIWNQIVTNGYRGITGIQNIANITGTFIISALFIVFCLSIIRKTIEDISKEIFNNKYLEFKHLIILLESVLLQLLREKELSDVK